MRFTVDLHAHTISSGHAYSTIKEYADEAAQKGLELIAITDHAPNMPGSAGFLHFLNLKNMPRVINGVELLLGVELNILDQDGTIDLEKGIVKKLDLVIASLHLPCIKAGTREENTKAVICAMKNPLIDIIGHLGDPRYPIDIEAVVKAAKDTNTIIELNNASLNPYGSRAGGDEIILKLLQACKEKEVSISLGSDAHIYSDIGNFDNLTDILAQANLPGDLIVNTSKEKTKQFIQ